MRSKIMLGLVGLLFLVSCKDDALPTPNPDFVYFLVSEPGEEAHDSYILPLTDAAHIAEARNMIAHPEEGKIILAEITKSNSVNYYVNGTSKNPLLFDLNPSPFSKREGYLEFLEVS